MNIAIVGAGAIGCRIAAHLAQRGTPFVLFDGWAEHVRALQQEGLRLRRAGVESRFPVRACMFDAPPPCRWCSICWRPMASWSPARTA